MNQNISFMLVLMLSAEFCNPEKPNRIPCVKHSANIHNTPLLTMQWKIIIRYYNNYYIITIIIIIRLF